MLNNIILGTSLGLILYTINITLYVKGIIFRPNDQGDIVFTPSNLFNLILHPLYSTDFWRPKLWTMNSILHIILSTFIVCLTKRLSTDLLELLNLKQTD